MSRSDTPQGLEHRRSSGWTWSMSHQCGATKLGSLNVVRAQNSLLFTSFCHQETVWVFFCRIFSLLYSHRCWRTFKAATWNRLRRETFPETLPMILSCWQLTPLTGRLHKIKAVYFESLNGKWGSLKLEAVAACCSCSPTPREQSARNHHHNYILHQI